MKQTAPSPWFPLCLSLLGANASAEIATDGTVGPARTLTGPDYLIGQDLGTRVGANLFHSFQTFNLQTANSVTEHATFTGDADITHVISRVTGGVPSTLDGVLRSEVGHADFYFLNPAGVMFGPNAKVEVPASFHVSTADELRMADGKVFSAIGPSKSSLGLAPPEAFSFLRPQAGNLVMDGSQLTFVPGSVVNLVGGDVNLTNATVKVEAGNARLVAQLGQPGDVAVHGTLPGGANGRLTVTQSTVDVSGDGGGHMEATAGEIVLTGAYLFADNYGTKDAAQGVEIRTGTLLLEQGSGITTDVLGPGSAGPNTIRVEEKMAIQGGSWIGSNTFAAGNAGIIDIQAGELRIDGQGNFATIANGTNQGATGNAGAVVINVKGLLELSDGAEIFSSTVSEGNAGTVAIQANELRIDRRGSELFTGIASDALSNSVGDAGAVTISVFGLLELLNSAEIRSGTFAEGNAGTVVIQAGELRIDGQGSEYFTGISSTAEPLSTGNANAVAITVNGVLEILNGAEISTSTFASGRAGNVTVQAGELRIDGQGTGYFTGISSQANPGSTGDAGPVAVTANGPLVLLSGGSISSSTFASGNAGTVTVQAEDLLIDDRGAGHATGVVSTSEQESTGLAGNVTVQAERIALSNGGDISISHLGDLNDSQLAGFPGGHLIIDAEELTLQGGSFIRANAKGNAPASAIDIHIHDRLVVEDSGISTSANTNDGGPITLRGGILTMHNGQVTTSTQGGDGGDIRIAADILLMETGFIQANTTEGAAGGNVVIDVPYLLTPYGIPPIIGGDRLPFTADSGINIIQAAAPAGNPGQINLTSPNLDLSGEMVRLSTRLFERTRLADDPCTTLKGAQASSITEPGRGGIPQTPQQPAAVFLGGGRLDRLLGGDKGPHQTTLSIPQPRIDNFRLGCRLH